MLSYQQKDNPAQSKPHVLCGSVASDGNMGLKIWLRTMLCASECTDRMYGALFQWLLFGLRFVLVACT